MWHRISKVRTQLNSYTSVWGYAVRPFSAYVHSPNAPGCPCCTGYSYHSDTELARRGLDRMNHHHRHTIKTYEADPLCLEEREHLLGYSIPPDSIRPPSRSQYRDVPITPVTITPQPTGTPKSLTLVGTSEKLTNSANNGNVEHDQSANQQWTGEQGDDEIQPESSEAAIVLKHKRKWG